MHSRSPLWGPLEEMRCPSCNADNQPSAKFCVECGSAFQTTCVKCGFSNPPAAKFCQECGASFKPAPPAQTLRVVAESSWRKPAAYEGLSSGLHRPVTLRRLLGWRDIDNSNSRAQAA